MTPAKVTTTFFVPGAIVLGVAAGVIHLGGLEEWFPSASRVYPFVVLLSGLLLGWRFHRSKLVFGVLSLVLLDRAFAFVREGGAGNAQVYTAYALVSFLLPLSLASIAVTDEKGVLSVHGICRLCLVLLQWPAVMLLSRYPDLRVNQWLQAEWLDVGWLSALPWPQLGFFMFLLALGTAAIAYLRAPSAIEAGLFWSIVSAGIGTALGSRDYLLSLYAATSGLIMVVSAVEVSFGMAFRDELTGLPARRALNEALLRLGNRYAVAMVDVDHFKNVNDRYGHDVGDQVLRMVAAQLARVRGGGKAYRYGGEEFCVLFANKTRKEVRPFVEDVRAAIEDLDFVVRGPGRPRSKPESPKPVGRRKVLTVTVSAGISDSAKVPDDPLGVIRAADKALYRAKRAGRNCVRL